MCCVILFNEVDVVVGWVDELVFWMEVVVVLVLVV